MNAATSRSRADPTPSSSTTFAPHDLGEGRLELGIPNGRPQKVLRIDATGVPATLIGRLLVGSYITGQDQILVTARGGLSAEQRREVHHVADRLLGMSVVGETPAGIEVENFVDPGKHELPRLLHRLVEILRAELRVCHAAILGVGGPELERLEGREEEVDQLYLLIVRQLLVSSDNSRVAHEIDVESHHYQIGDRLVAKMLEVIGDMVHEVGIDLRENHARLRRSAGPLTRELAGRIQRFDDLLTRTMSAFAAVSVTEADGILNEIAALLREDGVLGPRTARRTTDPKVAVVGQRIVSNLVRALDLLVVINEVTINRAVEPETVAATGRRVVVGGRRGSRSVQTSHPVEAGAHFPPLDLLGVDGSG